MVIRQRLKMMPLLNSSDSSFVSNPSTMASDLEEATKEIKIDLDDDNEEQQEPLISTEDNTSDINEEANSYCACDNACCRCFKSTISKMDALDKKLSSYIFRWSPGKVIDCLIAIPCLAFSYFGFPLWIVIYIIIMESYLYALCVLVSIVVTQILKRTIKRKRPKASDLGNRWFYLSFEDSNANHSFPSGDTAQSAVFSVTLGYSISKYYFLGIFIITPLVGLGIALYFMFFLFSIHVLLWFY